MNSIDEPATSKQLEYLKEHGYEPDHSLTKTEALELIRKCGGHHLGTADHPGAPAALHPAPEHIGGPFVYRKAVELAFGEARQAAETARQDFWIDTCREPTTFQIGSSLVRELYKTHGCLFCPPSHLQAKEVLDALDTALPTWDRDHPELFYDTLKLNFPELLRTH